MSRERKKAEPVKQLENEKVIITEWKFLQELRQDGMCMNMIM